MSSTDKIALNKLLTVLARQGGSDLHLTVGSPPVIRKDGQLMQLESEEITTINFLEELISSFLNEREKKLLEKRSELTLTKSFSKGLRCRVYIYRQKGHYSLAFRYIPLCSKKISDLNLPEHLERTVRKKEGLIIVAGMYDSGKSTTIAAILNTLNELGPSRYINTLEKPIEYLFSNNHCIIEQREVGQDISSYAQGLELVLEGDIDMVVLDRISEGQSVKKIFSILEAGKTVILTIDSFSSESALSRLISLCEEEDLEWSRQLLADRLLCVLNQKLLSRLGGGRALVYEYLVNDDQIALAISSGELDRIPGFLRNATEFDMISMEQSLAKLVQKGEIKMDQALEEANDKHYLRTLLR